MLVSTFGNGEIQRNFIDLSFAFPYSFPDLKTMVLTTKARNDSTSAKSIRAEGNVPVVLYGNDIEHTQMLCEYSELYRTYAKAGESTIVELDIEGKHVPVLFYELQFDPVTDAITHVDFYAVNMKKEIEARIPLHFVGESLAVKELGGVMVTVMDHLTVTCLPKDLPAYIEVNIESLQTFMDAITVADISVPQGVTVDEESETMIVTVQEPRRETEEASAEAAEATPDAAAEGDKKKEGEGEAEKSS